MILIIILWNLPENMTKKWNKHSFKNMWITILSKPIYDHIWVKNMDYMRLRSKFSPNLMSLFVLIFGDDRRVRERRSISDDLFLPVARALEFYFEYFLMNYQKTKWSRRERQIQIIYPCLLPELLSTWNIFHGVVSS